MQLDFHHGVMYVLSRLAGFPQEHANVIAYSSQYVDDAINSGFIKFRNHPLFYRISTAHGIMDARNTDEQANQHSWIPFHFLPGGQTGDATADLGFVAKLICRQNSDLAKEMVSECIRCKNDYNGLHRLGITMHVYADTWAHQGFAGIKHKVNKVQNLRDKDSPDPISKLVGPIEDAADRIKSIVLDEFPLGHGAALSCPDQPYLTWEYRNSFLATMSKRIIQVGLWTPWITYLWLFNDTNLVMKRQRSRLFQKRIEEKSKNYFRQSLMKMNGVEIESG